MILKPENYLVPSQPHYNVDLQSILVNGQKLTIHPTAFATDNQGTIVDTGRITAMLIQIKMMDVFMGIKILSDLGWKFRWKNYSHGETNTKGFTSLQIVITGKAKEN
ncbi:unnamed protein product [Lactuca saligna]|nr:unnamed protein product [Lactuca saligna]